VKIIASPGRSALYPLLIVAAIAVIIFAGIGTASLLGWLPLAESASSKTVHLDTPRANGTPAVSNSTPARRCAACGTVQAVYVVSAGGDSAGLGAVAGGLVGGLIGSQVGKGNGKTLATIAGAGGGAYVGDQVEKRANQRVQYRVVVRMDDGGERSFQEAQSRWHTGDRVRVADGRLTAEAG